MQPQLELRLSLFSSSPPSRHWDKTSTAFIWSARGQDIQISIHSWTDDNWLCANERPHKWYMWMLNREGLFYIYMYWMLCQLAGQGFGTCSLTSWNHQLEMAMEKGKEAQKCSGLAIPNPLDQSRRTEWWMLLKDAKKSRKTKNSAPSLSELQRRSRLAKSANAAMLNLVGRFIGKT